MKKGCVQIRLIPEKTKMTNASILGSGFYIPERKVKNEELESLLGLEKGYIESTTGMKERWWALDSFDSVERMAVKAAEDAVNDSKVKSIDTVIITRDAILTDRARSLMPEIKSALSQKIEVEGLYSIDLANHCASFAHGCNLASLLVKDGQARNALVVASTKFDDLVVTEPEFYSAFKDGFNKDNSQIHRLSTNNPQFQSPARSAFLWGSGAGAVVIGETAENRIIGSCARGNTKYQQDNFAFGETTKKHAFCVLDGASIYKYGMSELPKFFDDAIRKLGLNKETVKVIPHQPQPRMLERFAEKSGIAKDNVMITCDYFGNMAAASIPLAYDLAKKTGKIVPGDDVLFLSFGDNYLTASAFAFKEMER